MVIDVISNSLFISKPSIAEKESKVTKSPWMAPCPVSATVTLLVPFVVKGFVKDVGPRRIGVTSYAVPSV